MNQPISAPSNIKQLYANELQQQIEMRRQREFQEKQADRIQDVKAMLGNQDWFGRQGGGAPVRDLQGNLQATRKNPSNPNYQNQQWFAGGVGQQLYEQQQYQQQPPPTRGNMSRQFAQNQSMINLQPLPMPAPTQLSQSTLITKPAIDPIVELQKRQRQLELQRDLMQQMDDRQRKKEEDKLRVKREREEDELRLVREREEIERRMIEEMGQVKLEARNLNETNFNADKLRNEKRVQMLKYQNDLLEQQNLRMAHQNRPKRVRTPVEDVEKGYHDEKDSQYRSRIEQRIIKELPFEVERTVKETVNVELQRLRAEMNLQTNSVAEQLISLKGQLLQANEAKHLNDEQLRRLKEELTQTKIIDEIRQRELYQAFLGSKQNPVMVNTTDRLMSPETMRFDFPKRPRPYYNLSDPYLQNPEDIRQEMHAILHDSTHLLPVNQDGGWTTLPRNDDLHMGHRIDDEVQLPDDYYNRQKLYIPKKQLITGNQYDRIHDPNDRLRNEFIMNEHQRGYKDDLISIIGSSNQYVMEEDEVKDVLKRYDAMLEKYRKLDSIDAKLGGQGIDGMDDALYDLISQQASKYDTTVPPKPFEYNDYYFPDFGEQNFNNKLGSIYAR